jgi:2-C-methyl-D-erythritol 4-phosphate cytidylyltransferase
VNQKGPILLHDNARPQVSQLMLQKLNQLSYETASATLFIRPVTDYHFLKHLDNFLQEKIFNNHAESAFNESVGSRTLDFYQSGITKLVSH